MIVSAYLARHGWSVEETRPECFGASESADSVLGRLQADRRQTRLVPLATAVLSDDGRVNGDLRFTRNGLTRLLKAVGMTQPFMALAQSEGFDAAVQTVRHLMRVAGSDARLVVRGQLITGAVASGQEWVHPAEVLEQTLQVFDAQAREQGVGRFSLSRAQIQEGTFHGALTMEADARLHLPGDVIRAGVSLHVVDDAVRHRRVDGFLYRLICANGMLAPVFETKQTRPFVSLGEMRKHVGVAVQASLRHLRRVLPSVEVRVTRTNSQDLFLKGVSRFGRQFAESVAQAAEQEAQRAQRDVRAYDWWNAVTSVAKGAQTLTRRLAIESYASGILEWAERQIAASRS